MFRIAHIASFDGNIGDACNHDGLRRLLSKALPGRDLRYKEYEIRHFYNNYPNRRQFDKEFIDELNQYDFIVIGGGGFFRVEWEHSSTGTTIDITPDILNSVTKPLILHGLGYSSKKSNPDSLKKFDCFLSVCDSKNNIMMSLRNDGSYERFMADFSDRDIIKVPDGGFFCNPPCFNHIEAVERGRIVTMNFGGDESYVSQNDFLIGVEKTIEFIMNKYKDVSIVFVPHIHLDLNVIGDVLSRISEKYRRYRVTIAPLLNGTITDGRYIADLYRRSCLNIGMRFHSNVLAISGSVPSIGIGTRENVKKLFDELEIPEWFISIKGENHWTDELVRKIGTVLDNNSSYPKELKRIKTFINMQGEEYIRRLKGFLKPIL